MLRPDSPGRGQLSAEFALVLIFMLAVYSIIVGQINELNNKNLLYREETVADNFGLEFAKKLDMASYSKGYSTYISTYINVPRYLGEEEYVLLVENDHLAINVSNREYITPFNHMLLMKNDSGITTYAPFTLDPGRYNIKNIGGTVYLEKV